MTSTKKYMFAIFKKPYRVSIFVPNCSLTIAEKGVVTTKFSFWILIAIAKISFYHIARKRSIIYTKKCFVSVFIYTCAVTDEGRKVEMCY